MITQQREMARAKPSRLTCLVSLQPARKLRRLFLWCLHREKPPTTGRTVAFSGMYPVSAMH